MEKEFVKLNHIYKIYPNGVEAVHDFSFCVKQHDFVVIVGPSGCGKSTTLRMIAGLEDISKGELYIDGIFSNAETPKDRNIAMVFQSYSLYPHMTVKENIGFGLKMRKIAEIKKDKNGNDVTTVDTKKINKIQKEIKTLNEYIIEASKKEPNEFLNKQIDSFKQEIELKEKEIKKLEENPLPTYIYRKIKQDELDKKVNEAARILELSDYLDRHPYELSGGQRQRVALGRAIVRNAKIFLMDEPLSNLDAKLRASMRSEIIKLHRDLNATIIYVTHDQTEAMTMASKIVVMNHGLIQQIGTPKEVYNSPNNTFVANFIGSPAMNIIRATYQNGKLIFDKNNSIDLEDKYISMHDKFYKEQINKYEEYFNLLNCDNETALLYLLTPLYKHLTNLNKLKNSLINEQKNYLISFFDKLNENHNYINDSNEDIKAYKNIFNNYKNEIKVLLKNNDFNSVKQFEVNDEKIKSLFLEEINRINNCLSIFLDNISSFNSNNLLENIFSRLLLINNKNTKSNKEYLSNLINEVKDQVIFGGVSSIKKEKINNLIEELKNPLTIDNATIKEIYDCALKIDSKDEVLSNTLEMIDTANKSKKVTNLLSNELILKNLINGIINNYKNNLIKEHKILFGIRPEDIHIDDLDNRKKYGDLSFNLKIEILETLGKEYIIHSHLGKDALQAELICEVNLEEKEQENFLFNKNKFSLFDTVSTKRINME